MRQASVHMYCRTWRKPGLPCERIITKHISKDTATYPWTGSPIEDPPDLKHLKPLHPLIPLGHSLYLQFQFLFCVYEHFYCEAQGRYFTEHFTATEQEHAVTRVFFTASMCSGL